MDFQQIVKKIHFTSDSKIIKQEEYLEFIKATDLVAYAQKEAENILAGATTTFNLRKEKGYQEGLEKSKELMVDQLFTHAQKSIDYISQLEKSIVMLITNTLFDIIGSIDKSELIVALVRKSLYLFQDQKKVIIKTAPSEADSARQDITKLIDEFTDINWIEVVGDPKIARGDCILESDIGILHDQPLLRIEHIKQQLLNFLSDKEC